MRMIAIAALLVTGCGPMQLAGNWNVSLASANDVCVGTMSLQQAGAALSGAFACTASKSNTGIQGSITGSLAGDDVSLTCSPPGFAPALVTAKASDDHHMAGAANGSGLNNAQFSAVKF